MGPRHIRMFVGDILRNCNSFLRAPQTCQRACHPYVGIESKWIERAQRHRSFETF